MKLLTLPLVCLLFSGCSFLSELFIQNRSKTTDVVVTITYKIPRAEFVRKEAGMSYVPQIVTPKQYRRDKQKAALAVTNRSDSTISILVPASSTARIASTSNNKSYGDQILKVSHNGKHIPIKELLAISKRYRWDYVYITE